MDSPYTKKERGYTPNSKCFFRRSKQQNYADALMWAIDSDVKVS